MVKCIEGIDVFKGEHDKSRASQREKFMGIDES